MSNKREEKRRYWSRHIQSWRQSGQTAQAYCRRHQLKSHQFQYWRQVFETPAGQRQAPKSGFIELNVTPPPIGRTTGLTVTLPNGLQIEGVDAGNLALVQHMMEWRQ